MTALWAVISPYSSNATFKKVATKKADTTFGGVSVLPPFSEYILLFLSSSRNEKARLVMVLLIERK
jgi:hypothetical protein